MAVFFQNWSLVIVCFCLLVYFTILLWSVLSVDRWEILYRDFCCAPPRYIFSLFDENLHQKFAELSMQLLILGDREGDTSDVWSNRFCQRHLLLHQRWKKALCILGYVFDSGGEGCDQLLQWFKSQWSGDQCENCKSQKISIYKQKLVKFYRRRGHVFFWR